MSISSCVIHGMMPPLSWGRIMHVQDSEDLFLNYLEVCNQALALNHNKFPFKQILGAAGRAEAHSKIEVNIEGDKSFSYIITIDGNKIHGEPHGSCASCNCDKKWITNSKYLETVTGAPENYIQNPAKLNWDWMTD